MNTRKLFRTFHSFTVATLVMIPSGCVRYTTVTHQPGSNDLRVPDGARDCAQSAWSLTHVIPYTVGRYVDGNDRGILHESHTLYRREVSAHPNRMLPDSLLQGRHAATAAASSLAMVRDALTADLNEQRAASAELIEQSQALGKVLKQLDSQTQEFREMTRKGLQIHAQLQAVSNRLESLEQRLRSVSKTPNPLPKSADANSTE